MRLYETISREQLLQLRRALQRWENEGGAGGREMSSSAVKTDKSSDLKASDRICRAMRERRGIDLEP